jgi:hypothetical protein
MQKFLSLLAGVVGMCFFPAGVTQAQTQTTIKGTDCVLNGEGFFQTSNICSELSMLAKAEGLLASNDNFKQVAVSSALFSLIISQYSNCNPKPTYFITDGGFIDLLDKCPGPVTTDCRIIKDVVNQAQQYLDKFKEGGTKKVLWIRYADPQGSALAYVKENLDVAMPEIEKVCKASTDPKVLWVDLRPIWEGHYNEYMPNDFRDGLHCTSAGGTATAEALWKAMKESDFFDTSGNGTVGIAKPISGAPKACCMSVAYNAGTIRIRSGRTISVIRIVDVQGKVIFSWKPATRIVPDLTIPINHSASGLYLVKVTAAAENIVRRIVLP